MTTLQRVIKYCAMAFAIFLSVSIIGGICSALGMLSIFFDDNDNTTGEKKSYAISNEIKSLDIDIGAADLRVVIGKSFSLESNYKNLSVKEKNGTLKISKDNVFNWFGSSHKGASVVLTIPDGFTFDDVDISTGAGKTDIDVLSAVKADLELGAGETIIGCLNVHSRTQLECGAGKMAIQGGEMNDLSAEIGVGKLELTGKLTGSSNVDYGVGTAELNLLGSRDDYRIELDKGLGSATLDGKSMSDEGVYGNGKNRISVDGGVGRLRIQFEDGAE